MSLSTSVPIRHLHAAALSRKDAMRIRIPARLQFAHLQLARDPVTGGLNFSWDAIERICRASGLNVASLRHSREDNVVALIAHWYSAQLIRGGPRDPIFDDLLSEIEIQEARAADFSHAPGHA
jgi:hypothetical protein